MKDKIMKKVEDKSEDALIAAGFQRADEIYENIMNEYNQSGWYNDETDVIGSSQFLGLFHHFAECLFLRGWTKDNLNNEILNVIARVEETINEI